MSNPDHQLDRLLRAAAQAGEEQAGGAPFGFATRVVARWRSGPATSNGLSGLLRRVALVSAVIAVISTAAAVSELKRGQEAGDSLMTNDFAIADSAIQSEFLQ